MSKKVARKSNTAFVKELMEFSEHGAITQIVVMHAIQSYAQQAAARPPEEFENALISGEAWVGACKEIVEKFEQRMQNS